MFFNKTKLKKHKLKEPKEIKLPNINDIFRVSAAENNLKEYQYKNHTRNKSDTTIN